MEKPEVSIVFTSYNHKEYLCQALDSLLAQTFTNFELIIIDDCSTDDSQVVLSEYAQKDSRIRLTLNKKNSGSYVHSTNQGAALCTAPYIIFAQCDDWAESTQLEKLVNAIEHYDVGVVFSCSNLVDENGQLLGVDYDVRERSFRKVFNKDGVLSREDARHFFFNSCIIPNLSAALFKRSLYTELGGLSKNYKVLADWDFWLRATTICDFFYIREPLNNFRQHRTTIRSSVKMKLQLSELFNMFYSFGLSNSYSSLYMSRYIVRLWVRWIKNNPKDWLLTFPGFFIKGVNHTWLFPIVFFIEAIRELFLKVKYIKI